MQANKALYISICCLLAVSSYAQEVKMSFKDFTNQMKAVELSYKNDYSFGFSMKSYIGYNNTSYHDKSEGFMAQKDGIYYSNQLGSYSVQNQKTRIIIDSNEWIIGVSDPIDITTQFGSDQIDYSMEKLDSITQKKGAAKMYHLYYKKGQPYKRIDISIGRDDKIRKIIMYSTNPLPFKSSESKKNNKYAFLKVEIEYYKIGENQINLINIDDIVVKEGDNYILNNSFRSFSLMDFRLK
jgi:hypothetical protein